MKLRLVFLEMPKHLLYDYMSPNCRAQKKCLVIQEHESSSVHMEKCRHVNEPTQYDVFTQATQQDYQKRVL